LHNRRALLRDYRAIGDAIWQRFNAGPDEQRWYYRALAQALDGPSANAKEFASIVEEAL
jgi:hypothetical protein